MAREKRPAFPFYPKDWLPATRGMSAAARGYYIDLLSLAWLNDGCDTDQDVLRRFVGAEKAEWKRVWPELAPRWPIVDGRRRNAKLERVRDEVTAYTDAKRKAGQKGGRAASKPQADGKQTTSKEKADNQADDKQTASKPQANSQAKLEPAFASAFASALPTDSLRESVVARAPAVDAGATPTRKRMAHCAWESHRQGLSVPQFLHDELRSKMAPPADERQLLTWYATTEAQWAQQPVGEDAPAFWRKRFAEWQGVTPHVRPTPTEIDYTPAKYRKAAPS